MGTFTTFLNILKFLPEVFTFIKYLEKQISKGIERHELKERQERIYKAFDNVDRAQAARELNDVFRGRK